MAPDPKPQGRKRGRPANASKPAPIASQDRPDEYEADAEEAAHPKRKRRPNKQAQEDAPEEDAAPQEKPRKKRGRPSLEDKNAENTTENAARPKRKRCRPSLDKNQNEKEAEPEGATQPKRKRDRPSLEKTQEDKEHEQEPTEDAVKPKRKKKSKEKQVEEVEEQPEEDLQPRKRGRKPAQPEPEPEEAEPAPRKGRKRQAKVSEPEPEPEQDEQPRRSPRNSLRDLGEDANNKGRKTEKSKKKGLAAQEEAEDQQPDEAPKKRSRPKGGRPSNEQADEPQQEEEQQQDASKKKRRNKDKDDAPSDSDESLPSPAKPYLHIAPFKRTIRSSTIATKWSSLTGSSLPAAKSILTLAHQPILQRTSTTRNRRTHASAALHLVSRRIERKLARGLPFPPASSSAATRRADADGGRAMELDFEAVLDGKTALERQLVPGMHAVELLKAERDRMERELDKDYQELNRLEANARAQTRERKELFRKAHVLAPTSRPSSKYQDTAFVTDIKDEGSLKDLVDTSLEPLALQLAGHVDSIRGNLQQAEGVTPQLNRTKAALQDVLQRYLDSGTYDQVVLG
ncbi:hypothetical protein F53441_1924 [Fusarium austroafricanum]|uniref:Cylicin II n=1 Tax=Fusarium austroafricanum TaxID=2364996 RepID=A0A8H4KUA6_9HYPO|nr:hypothetical protein F53441_1924 [Fusarium austroafricanum]